MTSREQRPAVMQVVLSLNAGGTERLVIEIVRRLSSSHRLSVCCLDDAGEWASELTAIGVPVVPLFRKPGFHPSLGKQVARLAGTHGASILHCHHYSPFVYGRIAALLKPSLRVVFTEHGRLSDAPPSPKRRIANALLARLPGSLFAVSAALREHMLAEGFPPRRLGVILNGIDVGPPPPAASRAAARHALGIGGDIFLIGTAARLDPVKDLEGLVDAMARVVARVPNARLVIAGEGPQRTDIEAALRARNLTHAVTLLGYRSDVRDLLPALDVYVNSSISEGISLTILEAMAAALPVVATGVGGTPEVVVHGETGLLVDARNPTALADALVAAAEAPDRRGAWGTAGRARVERIFTLDRMVSDYAREYARLGRA